MITVVVLRIFFIRYQLSLLVKDHGQFTDMLKWILERPYQKPEYKHTWTNFQYVQLGRSCAA